jgi:hypothetical protein
MEEEGSPRRARDAAFCHETARRAVARAALHLGIESMSVEACDSLAGVLIAYLERIGHAMAIQVEASGRSSAHANLLDALAAVEVCTEAAVTRVYPDRSTDAPSDAGPEGQAAERYNHAEQMSWKGLAAFCFGQHWREPLVMTEGARGEETAGATSGSRTDALARGRNRGGKGVADKGSISISSSMNKDTVVAVTAEASHAEDKAAATAASLTQSGWKAPYPEEVVPFPVVGPACANPHALIENLLDLELEELAEDTPSVIFNASDRKRPRDGDMESEAVEPAAKKQKADEAPDAKPAAKATTKAATEDAGSAMDVDSPAVEEPVAGEEEDKHRPWHFPQHWPSYPRKEVGTKALVLEDIPSGEGDEEEESQSLLHDGKVAAAADASPTATTDGGDPTRSVRSALVHMGWGTMSGRTNGDAAYDLRVVPGAKLEANAATGTTSVKAQIVPLGRASISRVNRILEGSMDAGGV